MKKEISACEDCWFYHCYEISHKLGKGQERHHYCGFYDKYFDPRLPKPHFCKVTSITVEEET